MNSPNNQNILSTSFNNNAIFIYPVSIWENLYYIIMFNSILKDLYIFPIYSNKTMSDGVCPDILRHRVQ